MTGPSTAATARQRCVNHWPVFILLLCIGAAIAGIGWGDYSYGIGYVVIPGVIGYFATRKATTIRGLVPGYTVFLALLSIMIWQDISNHISEVAKAIYKGCSENNVAVSALPAGAKQAYCGCMSNKLAVRGAWTVAKAFALHQPAPTDMRDDPEMMSEATQAAAVCSAAVAGN